MALDAKRYVVGERGKERFLLSPSSKAILEALAESPYDYDDLSAKTKLPKNSLYVFCARLEKAKLIRRKRVSTSQKVYRHTEHVELCLSGKPVVFPELKIVR